MGLLPGGRTRGAGPDPRLISGNPAGFWDRMEGEARRMSVLSGSSSVTRLGAPHPDSFGVGTSQDIAAVPVRVLVLVLVILILI